MSDQPQQPVKWNNTCKGSLIHWACVGEVRVTINYMAGTAKFEFDIGKGSGTNAVFEREIPSSDTHAWAEERARECLVFIAARDLLVACQAVLNVKNGIGLPEALENMRRAIEKATGDDCRPAIYAALIEEAEKAASAAAEISPSPREYRYREVVLLDLNRLARVGIPFEIVGGPTYHPGSDDFFYLVRLDAGEVTEDDD